MVEAGEAIMADIMVVIVGGSTVTMVGTTEVTGVEVSTHTGDYGDGDFGDGLFWGGPMPVGHTMIMADTHI